VRATLLLHDSPRPSGNSIDADWRRLASAFARVDSDPVSFITGLSHVTSSHMPSIAKVDDADYQYRTLLHAAELARAVGKAAVEIDYVTLKGRVSSGSEHEYYETLSSVWRATHELLDERQTS